MARERGSARERASERREGVSVTLLLYSSDPVFFSDLTPTITPSLTPLHHYTIAPLPPALVHPVPHKLFPGMLPSTFQRSMAKEENLKKQVQARLKMAAFLQVRYTILLYLYRLVYGIRLYMVQYELYSRAVQLLLLETSI